jgi:hypothetical protein
MSFSQSLDLRKAFLPELASELKKASSISEMKRIIKEQVEPKISEIVEFLIRERMEEERVSYCKNFIADEKLQEDVIQVIGHSEFCKENIANRVYSMIISDKIRDKKDMISTTIINTLMNMNIHSILVLLKSELQLTYFIGCCLKF